MQLTILQRCNVAIAILQYCSLLQFTYNNFAVLELADLQQYNLALVILQ